MVIILSADQKLKSKNEKKTLFLETDGVWTCNSIWSMYIHSLQPTAIYREFCLLLDISTYHGHVNWFWIVLRWLVVNKPFRYDLGHYEPDFINLLFMKDKE